MTYNVKIRLTAPMLGDLPTSGDGVRHFRKKGNCLLVDRDAWMETFTRATIQLGINIDILTIQPPEFILMASTYLFRKYFSRVRVETFESFRKGTIMCLQIDVKDTRRAPTVDQLQQLLALIGTSYGISPWGNNYGFGRFDLIELT